MPTIEFNKGYWDGGYTWDDKGDEWSAPWGTASSQWYGMLLPRIHGYLPAHTILEIAPGYGRWTHFLHQNCETMYLVDLSAECIDACKARFEEEKHIEYFVNDGKSLEMIPEGSIDFVFSFDSLVHAEEDVVSGYLSQLKAKMKPTGVAFLHHSNLGEYAWGVKLSKLPRVAGLLKLGRVIEQFYHWRGETVSAEKVAVYAEKGGLCCVAQEKINWRTRRALIDCISVLTAQSQKSGTEPRIVENKGFMEEAGRVERLGSLYALSE